MSTTTSAEETQGAEPFGWAVSGCHGLFKGEHAEQDAKAEAKRCSGTAEAFALFTHPAPPAADHIGEATTMGAEREALCYRLKEMAKAMTSYGYAGCTELCIEAADMLAADAQQLSNDDADMLRRKWFGHRNTGHLSFVEAVDATMEGFMAQQVAVPQEKDKLCEGLSTGQVMQKAFAWCPTDHPHKLRMQWIADYFIANAPKADALAADHVEDVRAMVPMTDQELDDLLPTNDSMSRKDSQRWIARSTERHHKIGVKP